MSFAFLPGADPVTPLTLAVLLGATRRPRGRPHPKDWLRLANRLAGGIPPAVAALPEGGSAELVESMLAREDFRAIVAETKEMLAEPVAAQRQHLIDLARQAMERALMLNDGPVACFVLEEEAHDRDPAVTLADGVLKARERDRRPPAEPAARPKPSRTRAPRHPLRRMMERGAARMREDVAVEEALRHAARAAAKPPPRSTAEAARHALDLAQAARAAGAAPPALPQGLHLDPPGEAPTGAVPPAAPHPKLPQAP
jgi:hypothetical protein